MSTVPPRGVYPRPRGEAFSVSGIAASVSGLSPPTRGSPLLAPGASHPLRSIPAHAGKPQRSIGRRDDGSVYPRPRGEASVLVPARSSASGLSPPTRGSPQYGGWADNVYRSIPAHAGKPHRAHVPATRREVYPRPRGEAERWEVIDDGVDGLSPPTRGSPRSGPVEHRPAGSIPAHAGKPSSRCNVARSLMVYPRPRGEALVDNDADPNASGLSPPTRGSPSRRGSAPPTTGSIPAHAGKPLEVLQVLDAERVYPRPRGEASCISSRNHSSNGLSPPTRGSQPRADAPQVLLRSIPAHAGKPWPNAQWIRTARVYPRPRGEAGKRMPQTRVSRGLSPPTRGSPLIV